MSTGCTVCVRGYPAGLPPERVADKLTIHFLRARNGGGEIVNIEFAPETPDCAIITFEDASVAQRVLKAKRHVLSVSGENYPLEVTAYPTELNPNEVFVRVHMKIDYGCVPKGKDVLCSLFKQYKGIHFNFNPQEMTCSVKGSFTELQAFSSELLRSLRSKQRGTVSQENSRRSAGKAPGDGASPHEVAQDEKKETVGGALSIQNSVESLVEPPEDFLLVIDSDIYLYMQRFCDKELSNILHHNQVSVVDVNSDGVTTLYLQAASDGAGGMSALLSAHLAISQLSQQLEATLRKEKISKKDLGAHGERALPGELQSLCPLLLCHEDHENFYFVGNLMDILQAKQHAEKIIATRGVSQDCQKDDPSQPSHLPVIHRQSAVPGQLKSSEESGLRNLNSPKPNGKTEHKLAAKFSSKPSLPSMSSLGTPLVRKFSGSLPADSQPPDSEVQFSGVAATAIEPESQMREAVQFQKTPQGPKTDPPQATPGGAVSRFEGFTNSGFKKSLSLHVDSSVFRSLDLFDTTGAADSQKSKPRLLLRRSHSLSWQKPLDSTESMAELQQLAAKDSVNHLQKEAQEELHTLQKEVSQERMTQKEKACEVESQSAEQRHANSILLAVQRGDGRLSGTQGAENLTKDLNYVFDSFSYSELGLEGPEDEVLTDLCNYLKGCLTEVLIRRDRYKLSLAYPYEAKVQILEAFNFFFNQRKASLSEQLLRSEVQQGKTVDEMLSTESQRSLQQLTENSKTSWSKSPSIPSSLDEQKLSSQIQQLLSDNVAQTLLVQDFASNREAGQSKSLSHIPDANKQGLPRKPVAEVRQRLLEKIHFEQDYSKEECSQEAERAQWSLPILPPGVDSVPLWVPGKRSPPPGEAIASDTALQTASPGRESLAGECEVCQSTPAILSCHHTLCKTCLLAGKISPNTRASPVISGTFTVATLSQSLPGYYRDPTLKLIYDIPDGVQRMGHPRPGHLYRGGRFEAYLPDNPEGRRLMVLLHKAFERGLTFQIQSCNSEERVTWGALPHKTSMEGGKARNGYPDAQYLKNISLKLKDLGVE
uniref:RING-type E3 ubiquitin transferase n=3 Tax=Pogona vitticeps TaxID=103695 RepID=A0A6J0U088_9SAUR